MLKKISILLSLSFSIHFQTSAQGNIHQASTEYQYPTDPLVREKLETWRDQKFGMIIHWGLMNISLR